MCFGSKPKPTPTPAPAPAAPDPVAEETSLTSARKAEDIQNFGTTTPSLRVDRSAASTGIRSDGAGLKM